MPTIQNTSDSDSGSILLIDEEVMVCELLQYKFDNEGVKAQICHSIKEALTLPLESYLLVLVDLMGRNEEGLRFAERLKTNPLWFNIPIVFISSASSEDDVVAALDAGADDFISKPFSTRELIARVKSVLRRRRMSTNKRLSNVLRFRTLQLDMGAGTASIDNEQINLSRTEHAILAMFMRHRNQFYDRSEIRIEAWEDPSQVSDRTVDVNISRLRKKLGSYGQYIVNRPGFGYGFLE